MNYYELGLPEDERVPEGYHKIEAYAKGDDVVVPIYGIPPEQEDLHDCDVEGCGTLDHVIRFNVQRKYESFKQQNDKD